MFIRLLITSILLIIVVVQCTVTNTSPPASLTLPKQASLDEDYDLNDKKTNAEGSGGGATLDEYADEEDDDHLSKVTATTMSSTTSTTTTKRTTAKIVEQKKKNETSKNDDFDTGEFSEDYKDDLEDDVDYNEVTTIKTSRVSLSSTQPSSVVHHRPTPFRALYTFLTRPPIAAGILAGLAIGILTSVILLICIVRRFHKRERTHSSYTTGLLYPNQYGYSKSPQEFYA